MDDADLARLAFVAAAALHLGFQGTVTVLVYPALARVPAEEWTEAHARHSRAIAPLVVVVYGALVGAGVWVVSVDRSTFVVAAVVAAAAAIAVTAAGAGPIHGRLSRPEPRLVQRLLRLDLLRAVAATVCFATALVAVRH